MQQGDRRLLAVAPTAAGTYTVAATFPGSADYASVKTAAVTFTIAKATPTITVTDAGGGSTVRRFRRLSR